MSGCRPTLGAVAWVFALANGAAPMALSAVPVSLEVSESVIRITPSYAGELVRVRGSAPSGCDVVVKLTSDRGTLFCSRKGKVGPFWLAVGRVRFFGVPQMYKIKSTAPVDDIVCEPDQVKYALGRRGLEAAMGVQSGANRDLYLDELILIRERERLFGLRGGAVVRHGDAFRTSFFWPPGGPPGRYSVWAYAVLDGRVVGSSEVFVEVRATGVEAWVRDLARDHGVIYGLFAVAIAVAAGLGASLVFKPCARRRPGKDARP